MLALAGPAGAAPASDSSLEVLAEKIRSLAAQGRLDLVQAVVIETIAQQPDRLDTIMAIAVRSVPDGRSLVVDAAAEAFPGFEPRLRAAAAEAKPKGMAPPAAGAGAVTTGMPDDPVPGWQGEIALGGSRHSGNSETANATAAAVATYAGHAWRHELEGKFDFASDAGDTTAQRWLASYQPNYDFSETLYGFGRVEYEDDRFSGFAYQMSETVGLGYRLLREAPLSVTLEAGPGARQSKEAATGEVMHELTARGALKLAWTISEGAKLTNDTVVTVGEEHTLTTNATALTASLIGDLSLRLSLEVRNNSNPPPDTRPTDTAAKGSLVYAF